MLNSSTDITDEDGERWFLRQPGVNAMGCKANERTPRERSRSVTSAEAASRWITLQPLERYRNICLLSKMCFTSRCLFSFKLKSFFILFLVSSIILSFIQANPHFSPLYHNFSAAKCSENQHKVTGNAEYLPVCASTGLMSLTFDPRAGAGLPLLPLLGWRRGDVQPREVGRV